MGRVITENNKVKFEINSRKDCILYLGHIIEYLEKKKDIYWHLCLEQCRYLAYELYNKKEIYLGGDVEVIKFVLETKDNDIELEIDFYKFKLFNSSINLIKNEIINVIGDFSKDKISISYNNYLDTIKKKKVIGVKYEYNKEKKEIVEEFNVMRNYTYHFSSDKLCEWINFREEQAKIFKDANFEMGKEFNIYISDTVPYEFFIKEFRNNIIFHKKINEALYFMKKDFESLVGEKVDFNIKKCHFDDSIERISFNGFKSHNISTKRKNK